jgi:cytochrome P450
LPTFEDLTKLSYIEHIAKESLRLYPPAIGVFMRKATQDVEIAGYTLPRGSLVQPISWITHRDERWFPNPSQFEPDRWSAQRASTIPPGAWYPFGMGPRVCIGQSFAMMEMVLVVATLMQRLRFTLPADHQEPQLQVHMSLRPRGGLKLQLESV